MPGGNGLVRSSAYLSVAGAALCAGMVFSTSAFAGAFAVREQSSYYQGMSFAGSAAGDDLSSMFWNSAAAAAAPGINTSSHVAVVLPDTEITATGGAFVVPGGLGTESGDIGDPTLVPASYANYQINERWFIGVGLNSQYGFRTKPDNTAWAGSPLGITSEVFSVNLNPNLAYKLTDTLTVGVGLMVQYIDVKLRSGANPDLTGIGGPPAFPGRTTEGDDWGVGATAGVIWKPMLGTSIGVGYRSPIDVELDGTCTGTGLTTVGTPGVTCGAGTNVTAEFTLPELVTASFSQQIGERFRVLGTVEWTNWSRLGTPQVKDGGTSVDEIALEYEDGWFFSGGVEYAYTPTVTLRTGVAYEISPIEDDTRNVILPDDDRLWLSFGATMKLSKSTKLDIGYSHLFIDESPICQPQPDCDPATALFVGESDGDIDIVTIGVTHNWGGAREELEPLK